MLQFWPRFQDLSTTLRDGGYGDVSSTRLTRRGLWKFVRSFLTALLAVNGEVTRCFRLTDRLHGCVTEQLVARR